MLLHVGRFCAYLVLEKDYSAIILTMIGTVCACGLQPGCWVQATVLILMSSSCARNTWCTQFAGLKNRLKVIFHRICTACTCSPCVCTRAFNITKTAQYMYCTHTCTSNMSKKTILPRGDLSVRELDIW